MGKQLELGSSIFNDSKFKWMAQEEYLDCPMNCQIENDMKTLSGLEAQGPCFGGPTPHPS